MRKLGLGAALLLLSSATLAEPNYSTAYDVCMDNSDGVTSEMLDCIQTETKSQEARLNYVYKSLMSKLSPQQKNELRSTQRAWIKYKDQATNAEANQPSSLAQVNANSLYLELTTTKADELQRRLNGLN